ncbi:MAG: methyltransferase domain-containing protein [Candidatus Gastranaerophilales bacterium]|nr:methyltransferase domain-containing protein [Candidatus Gastranaerophilales bacterium]
MLDKELIRKKFQKSLTTYPENAPIQQEIALKLSGYIQGKYNKILEIGSYTGFLTKEAIKNTQFNSYLALDIVDSYEYIKHLSPKIKFLIADIEETELNEKFDLIISSSSLQWCNDFKNVIKKLKSYLTPNGILAIAIFGKKNLYQIKETFDISLDYPDILEVKKLFSDNAKIIEEIKTVQFKTTKDLLRHLKYTGVNSLKINNSYSELKEKMRILENEYKNKLTYNPLYIID